MSQPQMHTVCLRSADAKELSEGTYRWQLQAANFQTTASKAFLASIELPMSQWSIEEAWNRVYLVERLVIKEGRRSISVRERGKGGEEGGARTQGGDFDARADLVLPLHLNRVTRIEAEKGEKGGKRVRVHLAEPHGMDGATFEWMEGYEEHAKLVAAAVEEAADLSRAWKEGRLDLSSPSSLLLSPRTPLSPSDAAAVEGKGGTGGGYLHVPSPASPDALARLIQAKLRAEPGFGRRAFVEFDAGACEVVVGMAAYPAPEVRSVRIEVGGDALASLVGFGGEGGTSRVFSRPQGDVRLDGYASGVQRRGFLEARTLPTAPGYGTVRDRADAPPLSLRGDASALFGHATLRPGWYAPSQRIYSTSPPLRLTDEWELQFARFVVPRGEEGGPPTQGLVFTDPIGVKRIAEVAPGVYTASSISAYLQDLMNQDAPRDAAYASGAASAEEAASAPPAYAFSVGFEGDRFSFSCATADGMGAAFSLHFAHPRSLDPARFGFEAATLEGSDRYESSEPVREPSTPFGALRNLYQITEVHGQRKFCVRPSAPPPALAVAQAYDAGSRTLTLRCVTPSKRHVAHGFRRGAVVTLSAAGYVEEAGSVRHESVARGALALAVVVRGAEADGVTTLDVEVPSSAWIEEAVKEERCLTVTQPTEPSSFCFSKRLPSTVGGERLGFAPTTVQWGLDGAVRTRKLRVPPYVSPGSHNLDHVDYVLLKLRESNRTTFLQHESGGTAQGVFGKVCLNPTFRHERHLPVEVGFVGGDRLDALTLEVLNPDGTPYHFHGAAFSLSLTLA